MNIKRPVVLILICFPLFLAANGDGEQKKHVVLDLYQVLITSNESVAIEKLGGKWNIFKTKGFGALNLQEDFLTALRDIPSEQIDGSGTVVLKGKEAPQPIREFVMGKDWQQLIERVSQGIKNQKRKDEELLLKLVNITFHPKENSETMQLIPEGVKLIKTLAENNYTIHLLANWNNIAWQHLKEKFSEVFKYLNGQVILSGEKQKPKGPELFNTLVEEAGIKPGEQCIVVDTEKVYHESFKSMPSSRIIVTPVLCENKDFSAVYSHLQRPAATLTPKPSSRRHKRKDSQVSQIMAALPSAPVMVTGMQ